MSTLIPLLRASHRNSIQPIATKALADQALGLVVQALLLSACLASSATHAVEVRWESEILLGPSGQPETSFIADLDGDGRDEVLVLSRPTRDFLVSPSETTNLSVVGSLPEGGWGLRSVSHFVGEVRRGLVLRREGGDLIGLVNEGRDSACCDIQRLDILSGLPPRLERSIEAAEGKQLTGFDDISGDGDVEWVEYAEDAATYARDIRLRALPDGRVKWRAPFNGIVHAIDDIHPAAGKEVIVLTPSEGLVVLSGASGVPLWQSRELFWLGKANTGKFYPSSAMRDIGHLHGSSMQFMSGTPLAIQSTFWFGNTGGAYDHAWLPFDLNSDGRDEALISAGSKVRIFDLATASARDVLLDTHSTQPFLSGDVLDRAGPELVQLATHEPAVWSGRQPWAITVRDPDSFDRLVSLPGYPDRLIVPALADIDPAPGPELLLASPSERGILLQVRQLPGGALLHEQEFTHPEGAPRATHTRLVVEQAGQGTAPRVGLITNSLEATRTRLLGGRRLEVLGEYLVRDAEGQLLDVANARLADVDRDGSLDLMVASHHNPGVRLHRLDATSGEAAWSLRAAHPEHNDWGEFAELMLRGVTEEGPTLAYLWSGQNLYSVDPRNGRQLSASYLSSSGSLRLQLLEREGRCQFGARFFETVTRTNCDTLAWESRFYLPRGRDLSSWLHFADDLDGGFLSIEGDQLMDLNSKGQLRRVLATLPGFDRNYRRADAMHRLQFGNTSVLVVSVEGGVHVLELEGVILFEAGFERR